MRTYYVGGVLEQTEILPTPLPIGTIVKHRYEGKWYRKDRRFKNRFIWKPVPKEHLPKEMQLQALVMGITL